MYQDYGHLETGREAGYRLGSTMRIWYLVPYPPSLVRVRPYHLIRSLVARGHEVTLFSLWSDARERQELEAFRPLVADVRAIQLPRWRSLANSLGAVPAGTPLQASYAWDEALVRALPASPLPDVVQVEHLRGARYGLWFKALRERQTGGLKSHFPIVWDSVDCISLLFEQAATRSRRLTSRWITRFELGRTRRYEAWLAGQFDRVLVTSPKDLDAFGALAPQYRERLALVPNGVDLDYFRPAAGLGREPATLVLSGKMSYHANVTMAVHFVHGVLPLVKARRPDARVVIVGKDPAREVQALAADPAVTVTGTVPDLRPYLQRATIAVAPIAYGVGIQNKVLEAMACATPVVSTPQAVSALQIEPGVQAVIAETPEAQAQAIVDLLADPGRRAAMGAAARRYVEDRHDWGRIVEDMEALYDGNTIRL
jgi:sugar transferase (PEP-CTERM/EpsH1 system associated)